MDDVLPPELWVYIFRLLPAKDLVQCSLVCKKWNELANASELWRLLCGVEQNNEGIGQEEDWKQVYFRMVDKSWVEKWKSTTYAACANIRRPEMISVNCCNGSIFLGASTGTLYSPEQTGGLFYYENNCLSKNNEFGGFPPTAVPDWEYGAVNSIDRFADRYLVCGCTSEKDNIVIYDTEERVISCTMKHTGTKLETISTTWQNKQVSAVRWAKEGELMFSASPQNGYGVIQWDVATQKILNQFDHRKASGWNGEMEGGLYGLRDPHEIYGLRPTKDGSLFVSSSYRFLYLWDVRTPESLIKQVEFYPKYSIPENADFYMNQESAYSLQHLGFTDIHESILTVVGQRKSKVVSYEFPSLTPVSKTRPDFVEFELPGEMTGMCFTPFHTAATNIYGSVFVWSNTTRGESTTCNSEAFMYMGSGPNGVSIDELASTIGVSMSNPQSGWNGGVAAVFSQIAPCGYDPSNRPKRTAVKPKTSKKCNLQ